jgi:hypothetical protein
LPSVGEIAEKPGKSKIVVNYLGPHSPLGQGQFSVVPAVTLVSLKPRQHQATTVHAVEHQLVHALRMPLEARPNVLSRAPKVMRLTGVPDAMLGDLLGLGVHRLANDRLRPI